MADEGPGVPTNNLLTGAIQPSTTEYGGVSTSGGSKKIMAPEARAAYAEWLAAEQAKLTAMNSAGAAPGLPDEATVSADIASREQSALATPKTDQPAPPHAPVSPQDAQLDQLMGPTAPPAVPTARYTSQQFNNAPAMKGEGGIVTPAMQSPKTFEAAQDEAARDEATYKAKVADSTRQQLEAIEADKQARLKQAIDTYQRNAAQLAQSGRIEPYTPSFRQRFALALGSMGAGLTGGENHAQKMLQFEMTQDMERKQAQLKTSIEQFHAAGAMPEHIQQYAQQATAQALSMQKAKLEAFDAQVQQSLAPFPQFQQKAKQVIAEEKAKFDQMAFQQLAANTGSTATSSYTSPHTVTVTGKEQGGGRQIPTTKETTDYNQVQENAESGKRLLELMKLGHVPSGDEYYEYQQNKMQLMARAKKQMEGGTYERWATKLGQVLGSIPEEIYPKSMQATDGDAPEVARAKADKREYIDRDQSLGHQVNVAKFGESATGTPEGRIELGSPVSAGYVPESTADITRKGKTNAQFWIGAGIKAEEASKTANRIELREARGQTPPAAPGAWSADDKEAAKWATQHPGPQAQAITAALKAKYGSKP